MEVTLDTWIVSDTHFFHKNIIKYCNRPMHHNELMLKNWLETVQPEDQVLHLGDLMVWYGDGIEKAYEYVEQLPGRKHILRGNHDGHLSDEDFELLGFTVEGEFIQKIGQTKVLFSHYPDTARGHLWELNVHGHVHNNDHRGSERPKKYLNVSIEVMDYKPVRLRDILG